ncbi:TIGR02677 family protein [Bacillus sp. FJAT-47783]|uniref:TIGR02677 family protein n=1 Tax=Bacillus sp. FJAT-47783 TaxID=2922712 RepID=UPI001FACFA7C|nr:TIGR02677 family protein [Bacillus sp. FJAT-47783]
MDHIVLKPIVEATYLTTENAWRYRAILRYFYEQHERMRHYLFPEDVFAYLKEHEPFKEYTMEMLTSDLEQLVKWKNLIARQETGKVRTIEEFKKKRFRYQCSPYTVEMERMVKSLEKIGDSFGGSLEKTLFDRLYESLKKAFDAYKKDEMKSFSNEQCYRLWEDIFDYFKKLIQNSADYIAYLNSENIEERMMTEAFLSYKDALTEYLRDFIISLQKTSLQIELLLDDLKQATVSQMIKRIVDYKQKIPRLEQVAQSREELEQELMESWASLKEWFLGRDGDESELARLEIKTNETIRRMTRFAQRLGERHHHFRSRKKDYLHLAEWFARMNDMNEAHQLSATVFGVFHTRHLYADVKSTENIYRDIWDETPTFITIKPRVRQFREKTKPTAIIDHQLEKEMMLNEYLHAKEKELEMIQQYMNENKIVFQQLPEINVAVRKMLLSWLGKALATKEATAKIETGKKVKVIKKDDTIITVQCEDGELTMPNYEIIFL